MGRTEDPRLGLVLSLAWRVWLGLTAVFLVANAALLLIPGAEVYRILIQPGPLTVTELALIAAAVVWLAGGLGLHLLRRPGFRDRHGWTVLAALLVFVLYANVMRERTEYGDIRDYILAAHSLAAGQPFHPRYIYPPLWANFLERLLPLGDMAVGEICWFLNLAAVPLACVLIVAILKRYGYRRPTAVIGSTLFLVVNVPVLRTLGYVQVNLHVSNLVLIAVLAYPARPFLSALALALAVHLKISPAILAVAFLLERDWKWLLGFALGLAGWSGITLLDHGTAPFVSFWQNLMGVRQSQGPLPLFREQSLDSFVLATARLVGAGSAWGAAVIVAGKVALLATGGWAVRGAIRKRSLWNAEGRGNAVHNAVPILLLLMVLASPLVWAHHAIFLALPFLVMARRLAGTWEWVVYGFAWFFIFAMPTFAFYPWSYGRLLGMLLLFGLAARAAGRSLPSDASVSDATRLGLV